MVFEKLKEIVLRVTAGTESEKFMQDVSRESRLYEDLCLDSVILLMLVIEIEEEFGVELTNEDATGCVTVGDVVEVISRKLAEK